MAGSSRVGRVIPAHSGMTQPLVHPGSAWVDPGRAGVPGRVVPVAGSSRVWSGLSRVGRVIPRQPGPFQCSLNPAHPGHSTRPGSTRKPPVRPIFFSTVATCKYFTRTDNVPDRFSLTCWRVVNARGCFLLLRPHREEALTVVSPFSARIVRRNRKRKLVSFGCISLQPWWVQLPMPGCFSVCSLVGGCNLVGAPVSATPWWVQLSPWCNLP